MKQILLLTIAITTASLASAGAQTSFKIAFGSGAAQPDWIQVSSTNFYSTTAGYGFEPGAAVAGSAYVTSEKPFLFSVKLPEGNYAVTALLNDQTGKSVTTVKSEQRRLMLEKVQIYPGTLVTRTFIVTVRTPKISAGEKV